MRPGYASGHEGDGPIVAGDPGRWSGPSGNDPGNCMEIFLPENDLMIR